MYRNTSMWAPMCFVFLASAGCGEADPPSLPTYEMHVGDTVYELPVYDDPVAIQDDIVRHVKPLWDELESGESAIFFARRVSPFRFGDDVESELDRKLGPDASLSSSATLTTARYRFFKNRNGWSGMESASENGDNSEATSSPNRTWEELDGYIRFRFNTSYIRLVLMGEFGDLNSKHHKERPSGG